MFTVFLLLRWFLNSSRLHTPYAPSHSPEHPPASGLRIPLTDQWECPVNKTALSEVSAGLRSPWVATWHYTALHAATQHCHRDITELASKHVSNKAPPATKHHPGKRTEQSQLWFQQLFPSCKRTRYECTSTHREKASPLPALHTRFQWSRECDPPKDRRAYNLYLEDSHLRASYFHMCQRNTISSRYQELTHFYKTNYLCQMANTSKDKVPLTATTIASFLWSKATKNGIS